MSIVAKSRNQNLVAVPLLVWQQLSRHQFQSPEVADVQLIIAQRRFEYLAELQVRGHSDAIEREPD
eukprot:5283687-Pyramimonas_sp.AAC.1